MGIKMGAYSDLSRVYDILNKEIDYTEWARFIKTCFDRYSDVPALIVLDLACGTGNVTIELSKLGYDMIGVDYSAEMLSVAAEKTAEGGLLGKILYLNQDMKNFELYGTVGGVCCCLDSLNYLLNISDVEECFKCVHNYLDGGGLFIFDVNSPYKFENIYKDNAYILEDEETQIYCGWQNDYDEDTKICDFYLSIFEKKSDGQYKRSDEIQSERCYFEGEIKELLNKCGFELVGFWGDFDFIKVNEKDERWFFAAKCIK
jgi:SAM-dependent methyltransferase